MTRRSHRRGATCAAGPLRVKRRSRCSRSWRNCTSWSLPASPAYRPDPGEAGERRGRRRQNAAGRASSAKLGGGLAAQGRPPPQGHSGSSIGHPRRPSVEAAASSMKRSQSRMCGRAEIFEASERRPARRRRSSREARRSLDSLSRRRRSRALRRRLRVVDELAADPWPALRRGRHPVQRVESRQHGVEVRRTVRSLDSRLPAKRWCLRVSRDAGDLQSMPGAGVEPRAPTRRGTRVTRPRR